MIKIDFDANNIPIEPTLVIATKSGKKLGRIIAHNLIATDALSEVPEFSFKTYKKYNDEVNPFYDEIENFRWLWCKEYDCWYELSVSIDDDQGLSKTVSAKRLAEVLISQVMLFDFHINDETDIAMKEYDPKHPSYFWYAESAYRDRSVLMRVLNEAQLPNFEIRHVDTSLADLREVKEFVFDNISVYDALNQIAKEFKCLFQFDTKLDDEGNIHGYIDVYDLQSVCQNPECSYYKNNRQHYRGNFIDSCSECGSTNIISGYGKDTTIFIDKEELGEGIHLDTDTDNVKNCFNLVAGDDLMTATLRNCNPNGSSKIWLLPDWMRKDMSSELQQALKEYDSLYHDYQFNKQIPVDAALLNKYNDIVDKYNNVKYGHDEWDRYTPSQLMGFPSFMWLIYNLVDMQLYLETSMMPDTTLDKTTAQNEANKLTLSVFQNAAVKNLSGFKQKQAENVISEIVRSTIRTSEYSYYVHTDSFNAPTWRGRIEIVNIADEQDESKVSPQYERAYTPQIEVSFSDDMFAYLEFNIQLTIGRDKNIQPMDIASKIIEQDAESFKDSLKLYAVDELENISKCIQNCIGVLLSNGVTSPNENSKGIDPAGDKGWVKTVQERILKPLSDKLGYVSDEITVRNTEYETVKALYDNCEQVRRQIQQELDFEQFLTKYAKDRNLWKEFMPYRREQQWDNSNFVSDNLNNAEQIKYALDCIDDAKKDLVKASIPQHTISCKLVDLLTIPKFKPLVDYFHVGNFLRIRVGEDIYKLRLIKYTIDYDNLDYIQVAFSDVIKDDINISDQQSLLNNLQSMASSYESYKYKADKGLKSDKNINDWVDKGLDITNIMVTSSSHNQAQQWDDSGMWFKEYDSTSNAYSDKQMHIINSTLAVTDDNWKTIKTAIGYFWYYDPMTGEAKDAYGINAETIVGKLILGEELGIYTPTGDQNHMSFNRNGLEVGNDNYVFKVNPSQLQDLWTIDKLKSPQKNLLRFTADGDLIIAGKMQAGGNGGISFSTNNIGDTRYTVSNYGELKINDGDECHFEITPKYIESGTIYNQNYFFRIYQSPHNGAAGEPIIGLDHAGHLTLRSYTFYYRGVEYNFADMTNAILSAQSSADNAQRSANTAQSTANQAVTSASAAQSAADAARAVADSIVVPDVSGFLTKAQADELYEPKGSTPTPTPTPDPSPDPTPTTIPSKTTDIKSVATSYNNVSFKDAPTVTATYGTASDGTDGDISSYQVPISGPLNGASVPYVQSGLNTYHEWIRNEFARKSSTSDRRLKKNIKELNDISKFYMQLSPVEFDYIKNVESNPIHHYGLIAQDVKDNASNNGLDGIVFSDSNKYNKSIVDATRDGNYFALDYQAFHAMHISMIQSQQKQINKLTEQVRLLTQKVEELNDRERIQKEIK